MKSNSLKIIAALLAQVVLTYSGAITGNPKTAITVAWLYALLGGYIVSKYFQRYGGA